MFFLAISTRVLLFLYNIELLSLGLLQAGSHSLLQYTNPQLLGEILINFLLYIK
nr:MAG TPA: hypothetical protein [Caudoviricetes sp.]